MKGEIIQVSGIRKDVTESHIHAHVPPTVKTTSKGRVEADAGFWGRHDSLGLSLCDGRKQRITLQKEFCK